MTGFGDARGENERVSVAVEIRTVNNRYLKVATKSPDAYARLESRVEKVVREAVARGTVNITLRVTRLGAVQPYHLDHQVLEGYWRELKQLAAGLHVLEPIDLSRLVLLPGAVREEAPESVDCEADWPLIQQVLEEALQKLGGFRLEEGRSMEDDLRINARKVGEQLEQVVQLAPQVVRDYRDRLHERVRDLLEEVDLSVDSPTLIREVSLFAERCDVNEETTRLRCHLDQFESFLNAESSAGRKLEFLSQEMFREINTIGAKANNVAIAHCVVEMKSAVEKIREVLQNVE